MISVFIGIQSGLARFPFSRSHSQSHRSLLSPAPSRSFGAAPCFLQSSPAASNFHFFPLRPPFFNNSGQHTPPSFAQTDQIRLSFRNADTQNTRSLIHSLPSPATRIHTRTDNQLPSSDDQHDRRIRSHFEYEVASSTFLSCPVLFKNHRSSSFPHTIPSSRCFRGSSNYGS